METGSGKSQRTSAISFSLWLALICSGIGFPQQSGSPEHGIVYSLLEIAQHIHESGQESRHGMHVREIVEILRSSALEKVMRERQPGGLLDDCLEVKPADAGGLANYQEYVAARLLGVPPSKVLPEEASRRLTSMAEEIEQTIVTTDQGISSSTYKDYAADRTDLVVLGLLARYEARRILAGSALALFYSTGDESALQSAESHAAAGLEIWQRLVRLNDGVKYPQAVFGPEAIKHWKADLILVRHDAVQVKQVRTRYERYGLFDLALDFGPKNPIRNLCENRYESPYSVEQRFRPLDPEMIYSSLRRYGWRENAGIRSSEPWPLNYSSLAKESLDSPSLSHEMFGDYLRGSRKATLLLDLPDGNYRITAIVSNTPELAAGRFLIRAGQSVIDYREGESGDASMDARATAGRLVLEFIPEKAKDWQVSGLVVTRHAPHIAHVPIRVAAAGSRTNVAVTITAPDGMRSASIEESVSAATRPVSIDLLPDGRRFSAVLEWRPEWKGRDVLYHISAFDNAGNVGRLPAQGEFVVKVLR